jgi:hypothetical protein
MEIAQANMQFGFAWAPRRSLLAMTSRQHELAQLKIRGFELRAADVGALPDLKPE